MHTTQQNRWFSFFYRTRVRVCKGETVILNLSLLFSLLALLSAPWLAAAGFLIAMALGYRFSIEKNAPHFSGDFDEVMQGAARNVRDAMDGQ